MREEINKKVVLIRYYFKKRLKKVLKNHGEKRITEIINGFSQGFDEYLEKSDLGEKNYKLSSYLNIYTGIACYKVLQEFGYSGEEAFNIYGEVAHSIRMLAGKLFQLADSLPNGYKMVRNSILEDITGLKGRCWDTEFTQDDENGFTYKITRCIYFDTCRECGCPEFTKAFCQHDIYAYGNLHKKVKFIRHSTFGDGGDYCSDSFIRIKNQKEKEKV